MKFVFRNPNVAGAALLLRPPQRRAMQETR